MSRLKKMRTRVESDGRKVHEFYSPAWAAQQNARRTNFAAANKPAPRRPKKEPEQ